MQSREKPRRIASENGGPSRIIQLRALQDALSGVYGQVSSQVWKIRAVQNLLDSRYVPQHAKHRVARRESRIPIDATKHFRGAASLLAARNKPPLVDDREARAKIHDRFLDAVINQLYGVTCNDRTDDGFRIQEGRRSAGYWSEPQT